MWEIDINRTELIGSKNEILIVENGRIQIAEWQSGQELRFTMSCSIALCLHRRQLHNKLVSSSGRPVATQLANRLLQFEHWLTLKICKAVHLTTHLRQQIIWHPSARTNATYQSDMGVVQCGHSFCPYRPSLGAYLENISRASFE